MGRWSDADDAVRRYVHLRRHRGELRAQDVMTLRGARCATCGGPRSFIKRTNGTLRAVCVDCGRPWRGQTLGDCLTGARHRLQRGEATASERRIAGSAEAWLRLARLVEPPPEGAEEERWRYSIEAWGLFLHPLVHGRAGVVEHGPRIFPDWSAWWTDWHVREAIHWGRTTVTGRLARAPGRDRSYASPRAALLGAVSP